MKFSDEIYGVYETKPESTVLNSVSSAESNLNLSNTRTYFETDSNRILRVPTRIP